MYGIFTYIYHKVMVNVGKYTIHEWYGLIYIALLRGYMRPTTFLWEPETTIEIEVRVWYSWKLLHPKTNMTSWKIHPQKKNVLPIEHGGFSNVMLVFRGVLHPKMNVEPPKKGTTPQKINMEPENNLFEKEKHLPNHHFQVPC